MNVKAYFDRSKGFFTLNVDGKEIFKRLPCRSGQRGYENTDWVSGKSPIPKGKHLLWLNPVDPGVLPTGKGVGEFYPISSTEFDRRAITQKPAGPTPVQAANHLGKRMDIGLHPENAYPGSAGCIVIRWETSVLRLNMLGLFSKFKELKQAGYPFIELEVF